MAELAQLLASIRIPDLAGKRVLITGASTGIGAALARAFAQQGMKVAIHFNASREPAEKLAAEIDCRRRPSASDSGRRFQGWRRPNASSTRRRRLSAASTAW